MNPYTTNEQRVPGESPDWLTAAIERVRAEVAAESAGMAPVSAQDGRRATKAPNGIPEHLDAGNGYTRVRREWYLGGGYLTHDEYRDAMRQAEKHGGRLTDEPIGRGAPTTLTVIQGGKDATPQRMSRTCDHCGKAYSPNAPQQKYCSRSCGNKAYLARKRGRTA